MILSLVPIKNIVIRAFTDINPKFDIKEISINPDPSILGEDINVSGRLKTTIEDIKTLNKEVVIVLDISKNDSNGDFKKIVNPLKNFIGKLKSDKLDGNLKVGIVTYSNDAEVAKINNRELVDINTEKDNDNGEIKKYLGNLNTNKSSGNKNIGEALRQAIYLLDSSSESNPNADKTIIVIGEGNPNSRTINNDGKFYLDTSKPNKDNTKVITDNSEKNLEYAKSVGSIIKDKGYNVFTIGFDIDSKDDVQANKEISILREIHSSMTGFTLNESNYEDKGLFIETKSPSNNKKTIEEIFNNVSNEITKNYSLSNITMNLDFADGFRLKDGGNSIKLGSIEYKAVSSINNKIIYEAEIPFSFIIKADKVGNKQKVFDSLTINYPWSGSEKSKVLDVDLNATVNNNELPEISANLISDRIVKDKNQGDKIKLEYEIDPKDFMTNDIDFNKEEIGEVIFIIDTSNKMNDGQRWSYFKNSIANEIISKDDFKNIKFGVITYNDSWYIGDRKLINEPKDVEMKEFSSNTKLLKPLFDLSDANSKDGYRMLFQNDIIKISQSNNRNFSNAINAAKNVFDNFGGKDVRKAIVLINSGNVNYDPSDLSEIKSRGYKIISLDISNELNTNLKYVHENLGGIYSDEKTKSDYIIATFNDQQNYNSTSIDMKEVANRLKAKIINNKSRITPEFEFDLNNKFEYVQDSNSGIKSVSIEGNKLKFSLNNQIEYDYSGDMVDGKYKFTANKQRISFEVKVKESNTSNLEFGNSYMLYKKFDLSTATKKLTTPIVTLKEEVKNISHGLYNGINEGKLIIQESNNGKVFEMAQSSTATFGSRFILSGSSVNFDLNIDNKFEEVNINEIKIYKVSKDISGNDVLTPISDENSYIEKKEGNSFKVSIKNIDVSNQTADSDILVIYQAKVKSGLSGGQLLTNEIKFSNLSKPVNIITPKATDESSNLPDLF